MVVDTPLAKNALTYMTELLGRGAIDMTVLTGGKPGGGSEDFAFVSHEVPTVSMFLSAAAGLAAGEDGHIHGTTAQQFGHIGQGILGKRRIHHLSLIHI